MENEVIQMAGSTYAILGVVASSVLGGMGTAIGSGMAGRVAAGVLAEKPHLFTKTLVLTALPGSQAIYGLLIAFLINSRIAGVTDLSVVTGQQFMWAGILMGVAALFSGIYQGQVAAGGVGSLARDESLLTPSIVLAAMVETSAILGLLMAFLLLPTV
ncbi:V-type ATP synthase subunit K [Candidatus Gracilibacteria bacterium]|nr:V-type ATP synthase subunit K [Candidatus Gracilibacteria bacterium]